MSVFFYLLGRKGYVVLSKFIETYGCDPIAGVRIGNDSGIADDYRKNIRKLCDDFSVSVIEGEGSSHYVSDRLSHEISFAVGWRSIISTKAPLVVLHDSILPKSRGFAPLVGALVSGENEIGVTALIATNGYDEGDVVTQLSTAIEYPIKIADAILKIEPLYAQAVCDVYDNFLLNGKLEGIPQIASEATYSLWLDDQDYFIDWSWSSERIKRFIDAVGYPYAGACSNLKGEVVKLVEADVVPDVVVRDRDRHIGKIIFKDADSFTVVCGAGLLRVRELQGDQGEPKKVNFRSRFY